MSVHSLLFASTSLHSSSDSFYCMSAPSPKLPLRQPSSSNDDTKARGANRSTKVAGKLKVLPEHPEPAPVPTAKRELLAPAKDKGAASTEGSASTDEEEETEDADAEDVKSYAQIARIPAGTARRDALRLTKKKAKSLPRVTAYCTASEYRFDDLMKFFKARQSAYGTDPRIIDEVIYTPYRYEPVSEPENPRTSKVKWAHTSESHERNCHGEGEEADLLGVPELVAGNAGKKRSKFDTQSEDGLAEIFLFKYGTVVIWGMSEAQEKRFLSSLKRFEVDKLGPSDVEMEDLNFYYANYSRIYNDVITLRKGSSYMTKLSLSHALAQSVKISLFEEHISTTIEETKDYPEIISETGKINLSHKEIMMKMGEVFLLRGNIAAVGSVLDSPEVFWTYPDLQPLYDAARSYLEIPQRIQLLDTRVEVLQDMLSLLKESVGSRHSELLEKIVIWLIVVEICLGIITILVDLLL
ncbi:unnamed protein product [Peniophora sp. CBMAI 1063]|nr:unnamed protein product [Peniophora sp. CBMAI 1063]